MVSNRLMEADIVAEVLACEGDLARVAERLNSSVIDVRAAFLHEVNKHDGLAAASIEALMLLNQLQFMGELRVVLLASLPELTPTDLLKTMDGVNQSVSAMLTRISPKSDASQGDTFNFNGTDAFEVIAARLADLTKADVASPNSLTTAPPQLSKAASQPAPRQVVDAIVTGYSRNDEQ